MKKKESKFINSISACGSIRHKEKGREKRKKHRTPIIPSLFLVSFLLLSLFRFSSSGGVIAILFLSLCAYTFSPKKFSLLLFLLSSTKLLFSKKRERIFPFSFCSSCAVWVVEMMTFIRSTQHFDGNLLGEIYLFSCWVEIREKKKKFDGWIGFSLKLLRW